MDPRSVGLLQHLHLLGAARRATQQRLCLFLPAARLLSLQFLGELTCEDQSPLLAQLGYHPAAQYRDVILE
ncbi:hypothetical protein FRAAL2730 [Frankia alni ACN14a]|uniref:Uncharacterized protein n=1 Tax=Frankia alni (strain DSM 45986 / CECT 9034 / ACN14a) TaxID=326424 RepID=Q0RM76_FRAAA|nr:hypothetical protein FRAAL2730 [Frankia alni ACN14a]